MKWVWIAIASVVLFMVCNGVWPLIKDTSIGEMVYCEAQAIVICGLITVLYKIVKGRWVNVFLWWLWILSIGNMWKNLFESRYVVNEWEYYGCIAILLISIYKHRKMKQAALEFFQGCYHFLKNNFALLVSMALATTVRVYIDNRASRLSAKERAIKVVLSFLSGYIACLWMYGIGANKYLTGAIVPLATLLGEGVIMWAIDNTRPILEDVRNYLKKKEK